MSFNYRGAFNGGKTDLWENTRCECTDCLSGSCILATSEENRKYSIPKFGKRLCFKCQQHQIKKISKDKIDAD